MAANIVICGWNSNGARLLNDLLASAPRSAITIVSLPAPRLAQAGAQVRVLEADPSTQAGLEAAGIDTMDVAVVLADASRGRPQDVDARTILTVLAIEHARPSVHTIAELLKEENVFHAENASVDEVIIAGEYTGAMLSQAVQSPGMTDVFADLFDAGVGSCVREVAADTAHGKPFSAAAAALFEGGEGVLLGLRRDETLMMAPEGDPVIEYDDRLILLTRLEEV